MFSLHFTGWGSTVPFTVFSSVFISVILIIFSPLGKWIPAYAASLLIIVCVFSVVLRVSFPTSRSVSFFAQAAAVIKTATARSGKHAFRKICFLISLSLFSVSDGKVNHGKRYTVFGYINAAAAVGVIV